MFYKYNFWNIIILEFSKIRKIIVEWKMVLYFRCNCILVDWEIFVGKCDVIEEIIYLFVEIF